MVYTTMAVTLKLTNGFSSKQEQWLAKNVGPRLHYLHSSIGGQGWIAKRNRNNPCWTLTLEDERYATFFRLMFPE